MRLFHTVNQAFTDTVSFAVTIATTYISCNPLQSRRFSRVPDSVSTVHITKPVVSSIIPTSDPVADGTTVTITGAGFTATTQLSEFRF
jgi:endonuclease YncB( thermonuclease family)